MDEELDFASSLAKRMKVDRLLDRLIRQYGRAACSRNREEKDLRRQKGKEATCSCWSFKAVPQRLRS